MSNIPSNKNSKYENALLEIQKKLRKDKDYRQAWVSNIAMCYHDSFNAYCRDNKAKELSEIDKGEIANNAGEMFIELLTHRNKK